MEVLQFHSHQIKVCRWSSIYNYRYGFDVSSGSGHSRMNHVKEDASKIKWGACQCGKSSWSGCSSTPTT